jgi:hypothetical protein
MSQRNILPGKMVSIAQIIMEQTLPRLETIHSPRAMAFIIKGLSYYYLATKSAEALRIVNVFANRLTGLFNRNADENWEWFEDYLTYANSVLPESLLFAWELTCETLYKDIALSSFDFLLSKIFTDHKIQVISNRGWLRRGDQPKSIGEQPIDVAYTILALDKFYSVFKVDEYLTRMEKAFNWFLGQNRLNQIVYNPCTGGCYDGLEETHANINQGAESTICYLISRLTVEKYFSPE